MDILIAAIGRDFAWQAGLTARSIRAVMPAANISLYSDYKVLDSDFDHQHSVILPADDQKEIKKIKLQKILAIRDFPSDEFLFVDSDAFLAGDIQNLWSLSSEFDFAIAQDTWRQHSHYNIVPQFNTGVMFVRRTNPVQKLLTEWAEGYVRDAAVPDQYIFNKLFSQDLGIRKHILAPEMNIRCGEPTHISGKGMIFHKHHSAKWNRNLAAIASFINSRTENRIWVPDRNMMYVLGSRGETEIAEFTEASFADIGRKFISGNIVVEQY